MLVTPSGHVHQTRPVLVRDLSVFGQVVYLKVPRRQFYCVSCKTSPTEILSWLNKKQRQTNRYQEYIYEKVKELTVKQVSENEKMSEDAVQDIFHKVAQFKKKTGGCLEDRSELELMLTASPSLRIAHELKEELIAVYNSDVTASGGMRQMKKWLISARVMFGSAADTLKSHLEEICNYFTNRTTSGVTEGINTRIKLIIRQSYGFKNFDLMKEKLLACLFK